ncbi:uncharacterized protein FOMMEDRAFT_90260 [Fomitiporia mediterranea MF3/22]|uniref:uncharacterized protein n=1 Tax=Fomitiporia mediterranea (strain MF3/22) TaxID=694068 RepID=UPI0004408B98|nr:uncharacterized protein FOMMEDRAFT_90260 [Fomitiporia mediterranea MF3/22]EJD00882.1 hypothetical protein FOMMEDRAFT_90260 [Fomitiporia mediterranea MF3/22]
MFTQRCTRLICEALPRYTSLKLPPIASTSTYTSRRAFSSTPSLLKYEAKPRNHQIKYPIVQRVDEANDNKLSPPEPLKSIIESIELRTHFVELVSEDPPIVKIFDRKVEHAEKLARKAKQKSLKMERKEIQMTWNVGDMDLQHKTMKAREQLKNNNLVDIAFAPKAKQTTPSVQAMQEKMQKVVDVLQDVALERQERTLTKSIGVVYLRLDKSKLADEK